jgi:glycosyltransferase involved in cell wall biosynthesis
VLASVLAQDPAGPAEVIVVDDGSRDETRDILAPLASASRLVLLDGAGRGPANARNVGIRQAQAAVIAFTDDDCEVPRDWAARLLARLEETSGSVGGRAAGGGRRCGPAAGTALAGDHERPGRGPERPGHGREVPHHQQRGLSRRGAAAIGGVRRVVRRRPRGGPRLPRALRAAGSGSLYAPEIVVLHRPLLDWPGFLRQQARISGAPARALLLRPLPATPGDGGRYARAFSRRFRRGFRGRDRPASPAALPLSQAAGDLGLLHDRAPLA